MLSISINGSLDVEAIIRENELQIYFRFTRVARVFREALGGQTEMVEILGKKRKKNEE